MYCGGTEKDHRPQGGRGGTRNLWIAVERRGRSVGDMNAGGEIENTEVQYSEAMKARMIKRMTGPNALSATAVSEDTGIPQPTLSRWLRGGRHAEVGEQERRHGIEWREDDDRAAEASAGLDGAGEAASGHRDRRRRPAVGVSISIASNGVVTDDSPLGGTCRVQTRATSASSQLYSYGRASPCPMPQSPRVRGAGSWERVAIAERATSRRSSAWSCAPRLGTASRGPVA